MGEIMLSKNFSLAQGTHSSEHPDIPNVPTSDIVDRMKATTEAILEPALAHFGKPVTINSFYRCAALNKAVGSTNAHSQHTAGEAVDFEIAGVDNVDLAKWVRDNLVYDQAILEMYRPNVASSGWVHASFKAGGACRKQCLTITAAGTFPGFVV